MFQIDDIRLKIIQDSRGEDALEAAMKAGAHEVFSSVPRGKSRGEREAYLTDSQTALSNLDKIKTELLGRQFESLIDFDNFLLRFDGTNNKQNLGANLTLVLSQSFARLASLKRGLALWQYLREILLKLSPDLARKLQKPAAPYFLFNLINGGQHAPYGPKIQEYLIVPKMNNPKMSLEIAEIFFAGLKEYFYKEYGEIKYGDEGGLLMPEEHYDKPLKALNQIREELGLARDVAFSLDVAASSFYDAETARYRLFLDKTVSPQELMDIYKTLIDKYQFFSLEDPFEENDLSGFRAITSWFGRKTIIIGDDLTVTDPQLLAKAAEQKAISGIIVKPTQIGTITETLKTMALAHQKQIKIIVSHRSAETLDDFIADLAVAGAAWGLKAGAPQPEERMVKYKRVIQICDI